MVARKVVIGGVLAACIIIALGVALSMPKKYESTAIVQIRNVAIGMETTTANMVSHGINSEDGNRIELSPSTYVELMKSRSVMEAADKRSESIAEEIGTAPVAIRNFRIEGKRGTNLLTVTGIGKTPAEAQLIAKCLVDGFLDVQTKKNQETQTQLISVIDERIEAAQQEGNQELYEHLQRQREQHKIQLAMPSMDVQIIDPPDVP
ncbi:Wzz/FepE/Etk N-terminal domain-containing protein, partial [Selenomonas caprae]